MAKQQKDNNDDGEKKVVKTGKKTIDLNSIIGFILVVVMIVFGIIVTSELNKETFSVSIIMEPNIPLSLSGFYDPPSIIIVIGGVIASLMISYPMSAFTKIPKHLRIIFMPTQYNPRETIDTIVGLAKEARINGLLALEDKLADTKDEFLKNSLMLVVDSVEPEKVKMLLETELEYLDERHAQARTFYGTASALGPAFGMIGTLIGLIKLLGTLDKPETLGPGMSVALVTTLYGSILANVIFNPISSKLKARHDEEFLCKTLIVEGVQAIQAGDNPKFIEEKLVQLIPKIKVAKSMKGAGEEGEGDKGNKGKKGKK